ncbi:hypothetical protein PQX77_002982 [Marasmius sp. AFHP31]|nr:hypothetical protein PQX77_002982 [Marasmius sp. AFHP31]
MVLQRSAAILPAASLLASKKRYGVVKSLLTPRTRRPRCLAAVPVPEALRILRRQKAKETREGINKAVKQWENDTRALAASLAKTYRRKKRYFLDLMFQGGVRLSKEQENDNPFNAFKYIKAHDLREEGVTKTLMQITKEYKDGYEKLSKTEKKNLVSQYRELKALEVKGRNPTAKARAADVASAIANLVKIIEALCLRVGVEGFFCIVRDRIEDFMEPQWYFSNPAIESYLSLITRNVPFNIRDVGIKLQSFAIASCDVMKLFKSDKERIAALRSEIVDLVKERLDKAAGHLVPRMFYAGFAKHITWNYGVVAGNWPVPDFDNPSKAASDIAGLTAIRNAIRDDADKPIFVRLSDSEWTSWKEKYRDGVEDGTVVERERQGRSDKGKPRKRQQAAQGDRTEDAEGREPSEGEEDLDGNEERPPQKTGKEGQKKANGKKKGNGKKKLPSLPTPPPTGTSDEPQPTPEIQQNRPRPKPIPKRCQKNTTEISTDQQATTGQQPTEQQMTNSQIRDNSPLPSPSASDPDASIPSIPPTAPSVPQPDPSNDPLRQPQLGDTPNSEPTPFVSQELEGSVEAGGGTTAAVESAGGNAHDAFGPGKRARKKIQRFADTEYSDTRSTKKQKR